MLRPWPRKVPKEKVDAAGGDGIFIEDTVLVLGITAVFDSLSTLSVVPDVAVSKLSNLPFEEANSEDPKSSVINIACHKLK